MNGAESFEAIAVVRNGYTGDGDFGVGGLDLFAIGVEAIAASLNKLLHL